LDRHDSVLGSAVHAFVVGVGADEARLAIENELRLVAAALQVAFQFDRRGAAGEAVAIDLQVRERGSPYSSIQLRALWEPAL
jgi:hypothetical protein